MSVSTCPSTNLLSWVGTTSWGVQKLHKEETKTYNEAIVKHWMAQEDEARWGEFEDKLDGNSSVLDDVANWRFI